MTAPTKKELLQLRYPTIKPMSKHERIWKSVVDVGDTDAYPTRERKPEVPTRENGQKRKWGEVIWEPLPNMAGLCIWQHTELRAHRVSGELVRIKRQPIAGLNHPVKARVRNYQPRRKISTGRLGVWCNGMHSRAVLLGSGSTPRHPTK